VFKRILVPTNGSAMSRKAVARAVKFAREQKARIVGLWVGPAWEPNLYAYAKEVPPGFITPAQHAAHVRKAGARYLAEIKRAHGFKLEILDRARCLALDAALSGYGNPFAGGVYAPEDSSGDCGKFTRARVGEFAESLPPPVQVFAIFLVLVVSRRQQRRSSTG